MIYNKNKDIDMESGIKNLGLLTYISSDPQPTLVYYCNFCRDEMSWNVSEKSDLIKECDEFLRNHIENFHVEILVALSFMKDSPSDSWTIVFNQDVEVDDVKVTTGEIAVAPLGGRWSYTESGKR